MRVRPGATNNAGSFATRPFICTRPERISPYACERDACPSFDSARTSATFFKPLPFFMLPGPHPRSLSLGGFAPRSGRRRFAPVAPLHPYYGLMILRPVGAGGVVTGAVMRTILPVV